MDGATFFTISDGTANPIPEYKPVFENIAELTPITSPFKFKRGPPELPGFMAASVCMTSGILKVIAVDGPKREPSLFSSDDGSNLPKPLTTPTVREPESPNGFPIATTVFPTLRVDEFPNGSGIKSEGEKLEIFTTA